MCSTCYLLPVIFHQLLCSWSNIVSDVMTLWQDRKCLYYWATVCKMVCPMLSVRCLSVLSVCDVCALWPNGWTDQDETWQADRPRPWPHCVRWGPSSPPLKGHSSPIFGPCLLWLNGWMDEDATWYGSRHRRRPHCIRRVPSAPRKENPLF